MGETTGCCSGYLDYDLQDEHFRVEILRQPGFSTPTSSSRPESQYEPGYRPTASKATCSFNESMHERFLTTDDLRLRSTEFCAGDWHPAAARPARVGQSGHGPERRDAGHQVLSVRQRPLAVRVDGRAVVPTLPARKAERWVHRYSPPRNADVPLMISPHAAIALPGGGRCPRRSADTTAAVEDGLPVEERKGTHGSTPRQTGCE